MHSGTRATACGATAPQRQRSAARARCAPTTLHPPRTWQVKVDSVRVSQGSSIVMLKVLDASGYLVPIHVGAWRRWREALCQFGARRQLPLACCCPDAGRGLLPGPHLLRCRLYVLPQLA